MSNGTSSSRLFFRFIIVIIACVLAHARPSFAQPKPAKPGASAPAPAAPSGEASAQSKEEAKARFERGMTFFDKKVWDAALAEFLASRAAYPTRMQRRNPPPT